jgi:hypothetical protein
MNKLAGNLAAKNALEGVLANETAAASRVRGALGLPDALDEYTVARALYERFDTRDDVEASVAPSAPAEALYLDWLFYAYNIVLIAAYRELLFGPRVS